MRLKVNGEIKELQVEANSPSLFSIISLLVDNPHLVVVELNGEIISPEVWINTKIKHGDCLEVVTIVGGGSYS